VIVIRIQLILMIFFFACISIYGQSPQFVPEIDTHVQTNSFLRIYLQTKDEREAGVTQQFTIGPSVQFYVKPLVKLKRITVFDIDDAKPRFLVLEAGYRYLTAPNTTSTQRFVPVATSHFPLVNGALISDRNRADLDWKNGRFTWRYRNKLTVERTVAIRSYHFIPYVAAEPYYVSQYNKWSTTALFAGFLFPVGKKVEFNSYYEHDNNTGTKTSEPQNIIGLALDLYFSFKK
jgi:hypothetical protein